jgi:hypothetical protein
MLILVYLRQTPFFTVIEILAQSLYNSLKTLCAEDWSIRPRWTAKEEQTIQELKVENGVASWKDAAAAVSRVGSERSIKAVRSNTIFLLVL